MLSPIASAVLHRLGSLRTHGMNCSEDTVLIAMQRSQVVHKSKAHELMEVQVKTVELGSALLELSSAKNPHQSLVKKESTAESVMTAACSGSKRQDSPKKV